MISIIIPCYNEEKNVKKAYKEIRNLFPKAEIIIFDDASTDKTYEVAKSIARKDRRVKVIHTKKRIGRGASLNKAIKLSEGNFIFYIDADLAASPKYIKDLLKWLEEGYSIVTGSRYLKGAMAVRSKVRKFLSVGFNWLIRLVSGSKVRDHQCGLKGFNKGDILKILPYVKDNHWFWDSELLIKAQWLGLKVKEVPIKWGEKGNTKVKIRDIVLMFLGGVRMFLERIRFKRKV